MIMYGNVERNRQEMFVDYLKLRKIWGSHSSVAEDSSFLGCYIM
jgi:hypothetical protein